MQLTLWPHWNICKDQFPQIRSRFNGKFIIIVLFYQKLQLRMKNQHWLVQLTLWPHWNICTDQEKSRASIRKCAVLSRPNIVRFILPSFLKLVWKRNIFPIHCIGLNEFIHMGQIPQDGKNEQYVALYFNFWSFTVTKRLNFFEFSQLFWRDFVRPTLKILLFWS